MLTRKLAVHKTFRCLMGFLVLSTPPVVTADFDTYSTDWPNNQAVVDERKIESKKVVILSEQQKACNWASQAPRMDDIGKLYVKFGGWQGSTEIRHIRNQSYNSLANKLVIQDSINKVGWDWEAGAGFAYNKKLRFELEYVHHKTLNYSPAQIFVNTTAGMNSQVMSQAVLLNMFIDFRPVDYFYPYIGVLTGFVWNQTRTTGNGGILGNGSANDCDRYGYPWGLTAGARMPFLTRYFFYIGYRYVSQAKLVWVDSTSYLKLQGQYVYQGVDFGIQILVS